MYSSIITRAMLFLYLFLWPSLAVASIDLTNEQLPQSFILPPILDGVHGGAKTVDHEFSLRHIFHHGTYQDPNLHKRLDIRQDMNIWIAGDHKDGPQAPPFFRARSRPLEIQRLVDRRLSAVEPLLAIAREGGQAQILDAEAWNIEEIPGPNVTDKETILTFAKMTLDAYTLKPFTGEWQDVKGGFNYSQSFGWEGDGLRGHIYADKDNSTIVIGLKGTSAAVFDGSGTTTNDKINDNLFFSCCCAQQGRFLWKQVCNCRTNTFTCNQTCLVEALKEENRYYRAAINLYGNVTEIYPDSNIWLSGHSLGGAVSSLLGMTFGLPTITFEAPGDALPAARLGLPTPPGSTPGTPQTRNYTGTYHFGHTADPVYMGTCGGATATCTIAGYAFESVCHTGFRCVYDTVADKGWRVGINTHKIINVISDVLEPYPTVPSCDRDTECFDCFDWKFFESNSSASTSTSVASQTSSTSTVQTRTSVCKTPGWWGCLDKTTTISTTSSISTSFTSTTVTSTTTSCKSWGWFWCNDPKTTTVAAPARLVMITPQPAAVPSPTPFDRAGL